MLGTPAVSAPGCPPPHIHPSARAARRETSQRPHAVPARPSCAPPGYLRSAGRGGTQPWRPRLLPPAPRPQPAPRTPIFPQFREPLAEGARPLQTCSGTWGSPQDPCCAGEDMCAVAGPLESCGVPPACSLGAIWFHVLVTHQEGCAPRGSRRTHTASARLAQPPLAQPIALRPGPPSARPSPAPPPAETPAPAHCLGGKTLRGVGWGVPLQNRPGQRIWAARLNSLKCLPPSHAALPGPRASVIFPFPPLTGPIRCRGFLR